MKNTVFCCFVIFFQWSSGLAQPPMVLIPGGAFFMGDVSGDRDEKPVHRVVVDGFFMAQTETTHAAFKTFVEATGYVTDAERSGGSYVWDSLGWHKREGVHWRHDELGRFRDSPGNYPVVHVSWNDAVRYCNWLSEKEGLVKVYDFQADVVRTDRYATGYRLPTEAEWEYAAAGAPGAGWYAGNSRHGTHPVGLKKANIRGFFDLFGNVWEWCGDWYDPRFYDQNQESANPVGPDQGKERSLRGGSWNNKAGHCRPANRTNRFPDFRDGSIGFRVVRRAG